jgi:hypothetical protein
MLIWGAAVTIYARVPTLQVFFSLRIYFYAPEGSGPYVALLFKLHDLCI